MPKRWWRKQPRDTGFQLFLEQHTKTDGLKCTRSGEYLAWTDSKGLLALIREEEIVK